MLRDHARRDRCHRESCDTAQRDRRYGKQKAGPDQREVFAIQYGKHTKAHGQYVNHMRDTAR